MNNEKKIAYLCDYRADCSGSGCRILGGECSHTFDPEHAFFGAVDDPETSERFIPIRTQGLSLTYWEYGSMAEYREMMDFDASEAEE